MPASRGSVLYPRADRPHSPSSLSAALGRRKSGSTLTASSSDSTVPTMGAAAPPVTPAPASSRLRRLVELDEAWSLQIHEACRGVPRPVLKALEISGDGRFWFPLPIALLVAARSSPLLTPLLLALLAGNFLDLLLVGLVKSLVRRPRPVYNKGMHLTFSADQWSFPSGHSSRVVFIAIFLHLVAGSLRLREAIAASGGPDLWWRWVEVLGVYGLETGELFLLVVFMWSAATSVSRVLLGRHFVFDVIAGACLGVLEAIIVFIFYSWIR